MIRVEPTKKEKSEVKKVAKRVISEIGKAAGKIDPRIKAKLLGSVSRDTWLASEKDLDIFLMFPLEYEKEELERVVTEVGHAVLKKITQRYAEHPYVRGKYEGFDVEIVPCYAVESPKELKSAVDRTPFHDEFVRKNVGKKENEVRLLKQFLKGVGCYGAEAKVEGFSGYLCELLVIKYGSFKGVLDAMGNWQYGQVIRIGTGKGRVKFTEPLVLIDPVDEKRNVASALSEERLCRFIFASREYLRGPKDAFFFPKSRKADAGKIARMAKERDTEVLAVVFGMPDLVDDILYPQLRRAVGAIKKLLLRSDFHVVGIDFFVGRRVCVLIELGSVKIPEIRLHMGPKVNTHHEARFLSKYEDFDRKLTEPFIKGGRWAIFLRRGHTSAKSLLSDFLSQENLEKSGMPKYVAEGIRGGFELREGAGAISSEFKDGLAQYFDPRFPWEI